MNLTNILENELNKDTVCKDFLRTVNEYINN